MGRFGITKSILTEYGLRWTINRSLYSAKLALLRGSSVVENVFEHKDVNVQRVDLFDIDTKAIKHFLQGLTKEKKQQLEHDATMAMEGKIKAFSSILLDYGNPPRWNYNPLSLQEAPLNEKWYRIPDFDGKRGDIKIMWEASRFSHFFLFSRAFLMTGNQRYYDAFHKQLFDWTNQNRYSYGPNYKCGQECSLRMVNVLINYSVFQKEGFATKDDEQRVIQIVEDSYKKVLGNFFYAYKCIKNNHTISELLGMVIGAWCCNDNKQLRYAGRLIEKVIDEQFFEDGGYRQYSFNYQRLALQDLECLMSVSHKTGIWLSEKSRNKLLKSARLLYQMENGEGNIPNYGSNDGALIFPVTSCDYRDYRPIINCINQMIAGTRVYPDGIYDEELLWFSGAESLNSEKEIVEKITCEYEAAGLYQFRTVRSSLLVILNNYTSRPAHYDQLHMDLWVGNRNVFCDSGTYSYADKKGWSLAETKGHNTVKICDREQMNKKGVFFIYGWTKRNYVNFEKRRFVGEICSVNDYRHKRLISLEEDQENERYLLTDEVECKNGLGYWVLFHTPYEVDPLEDGVMVHDKGEVLCRIMGKQYEISDADRSLYYMQTTIMHCISFYVDMQSGIGKSTLTIEIKKG